MSALVLSGAISDLLMAYIGECGLKWKYNTFFYLTTNKIYYSILGTCTNIMIVLFYEIVIDGISISSHELACLLQLKTNNIFEK